MDIRVILQSAFENVAGHISHLDEIRQIMDEIKSASPSLQDTIRILENKMQDAEVTLVTDIRILLNEIRHITREKSS